MSVNATIPPDLDPAYRAAAEICRSHARSFHFASRFLPGPKRDHAFAVYAFCRQLDDAADIAGSPEAIDRFTRLLEDIYGRNMCGFDDPVARAFANTVKQCKIPREHFDALAAGCRMDFTVVRYDTWKQLERYCYCVAGVVGLIMCKVFDVTSPAAQAHAVAMGNAMQLTNILRDVREDMDRGRVYLPAEDLQRFKIGPRQLAQRRWTPAFAQLMEFEVARARALYREGAQGIGYIANDGSRLTASVMAVVYGGILRAIEGLEYDVFRRRASLSTFAKLRRLPAAMRLCRCELGDDVPDVFQ